MANREGEVQQWLAAHLPTTPSQNVPTFFYDLTTSTYVDGTARPLAKPGYSRDHRPDRTQIVIGLLITAAGDPVYWQVWPGNTPDVTTVQTVVTDLPKRLKLGPCILVFDRGMVSAANLAAIEAAHHTYLSAVDREALVHVPGWGAWPETIPADHWQPVLAQRGLVAYEADANLWYREWAEPDSVGSLPLTINAGASKGRGQGGGGILGASEKCGPDDRSTEPPGWTLATGPRRSAASQAFTRYCTVHPDASHPASPPPGSIVDDYAHDR